MSEAPKPLDAALDLFIYVPVGLAMTAAEELPKLAAKGRTRVNNQLAMARVVGQFAVTQGRQMVERRLNPPAPAGRVPADPAPAATAVPAAPAETFEEMTGEDGGGLADVTPIDSARSAALPGADKVEADRAVTVSTVGDLGEVGSAPGGVSKDGPAPAMGDLAIPGYDSLSASQVVQRLAGLDPGELAAVGAYERAHRGRRTVLNRVDQLRGE